MGGIGGTGARVVVFVVVLACIIADQKAESCGLEGCSDCAITPQPHHYQWRSTDRACLVVSESMSMHVDVSQFVSQ